MPISNFNWDKYFASATWNEIREKSPFLDGQRLPSIVHQEAELVYLSSLDLDFSLSDVDGLKSIIGDVKSTLQRSLESKNYGYTDLMVDGAPSPHQSDTTLRWLIDRLRS
jgi:hypothetical protein